MMMMALDYLRFQENETEGPKSSGLAAWLAGWLAAEKQARKQKQDNEITENNSTITRCSSAFVSWPVSQLLNAEATHVIKQRTNKRMQSN